MSARAGSGASGWQLILADLALILFLVTLSALANEEAHKPVLVPAREREPEVAPSQALFRPDPLGPTLREWLSQRPHDARATLTVFAQYSAGERDRVWEQARALSNSAAQEGYSVRVVITQGRESDLHASLAYDTPVEAAVP